MDKFLLAENPMRPEQSGIWIIHMLNPVTIIRCTEGKEDTDSIFRHYVYINTDNVPEEWTLSIFFIAIERLTDKEHEHLLDRAWRWFRSYMQWEDKNIDDEQAPDN